MNIPKIAAKTAKFKRLMAYTLTTAAMVSPGALTYGLVNVLPNGTFGQFITFVAGSSTQIILGIGLLAAGDRKLFPFPKFWQRWLDKPLEFLAKKENEKLYVALRELADIPAKELEDKQLALLAKIYIDRQLNLPFIAAWDLSQNGNSRGHSLSDKIKDALVANKVSALIDSVNVSTPVMNSYIEKELASRQLSLKLSEFSSAISHSKSYNVVAVHENYIDFLLSHNYKLQDKEYRFIEKALKKESSGMLSKVFESLIRYPQSTNWNRLSKSLSHYKNEDYFYNSFSQKIKSLAQKEVGILEQNQIVKSVAQIGIEKPEAPPTTKLKPQEVVLETETQLTNYMAYEPMYFKDKWDKIKQGYATIQAHRADFDSFQLIDFFTSLNGSLNVMIASDLAIHKLPESYREKAQTLLAENLELAWLQVEQFEKEVGEKHLKTLQIHKNYQAAKIK